MSYESQIRTYGRDRVRRAGLIEKIVRGTLGLCVVLVLCITVGIILYIFVRGVSTINWSFLTENPRSSMTQGGIYPAIMGTVWLVAGTAVFAISIGVTAGVYLGEFTSKGRMTRLIRLAIANMAGVPSIVYGLFGMSFFVILLGMGRSILAGALTLACLTLPVVIVATEESLRQIPKDIRLASLALGASKLRTTYAVILPAALPGIATGSILGLSRAAGETAPIILTAAAFATPVATSPLSETMALPYHLYIMATQAVKPADHIVWGTALVLVASVCLVNVFAALWRARQRKKVSW